MELLVVIAIIGVLVALIIPSFGRVQELARLVTCGASLGQLGKAMESYAAGNRGCYAAPREWVPNDPYYSWINDEDHITKGTLYPYVESIDAYVCPTYKTAAAVSPHNHGNQFPGHSYEYTPPKDRIVRSYVMNWNVGKKTNGGQGLVHKSQIRKPQDLGLFSEESPWFVYKDGTQYSCYIMNDACLVADGYPRQDCFADFHLPPPGRRDEGFAQVVMLDCHIERAYPWQTLPMLRQPAR